MQLKESVKDAIGKYHGHGKVRNASLSCPTTPTTDLLSSSSGVGIEIELENVKMSGVQFYNTQSTLVPKLGHMWDVITDDSLRGDGAYEFVFTHPYKGRRITYALQLLEEVLTKETTAEATERCSVHVHIDVGEMSQTSFYTFMLLYLLVEPFIYEYNVERKDNRFCIPLYKSTKTITTVSEALRKFGGKDFSDQESPGAYLSYLSGSWPKYLGINLTRLSDLNTIEFRMHKGTYKKEEIIKWVNILLALKEYADKIQPEAINDFLDELYRLPIGGGIDMVKAIIPLDYFWEAIDETLYDRLTEQALESLTYLRLGSTDIDVETLVRDMELEEDEAMDLIVNDIL